jgi:hypothetical protein
VTIAGQGWVNSVSDSEGGPMTAEKRRQEGAPSHRYIFFFLFLYSFQFNNDIIPLQVAYDRKDRGRIVNRRGRTNVSDCIRSQLIGPLWTK